MKSTLMKCLLAATVTVAFGGSEAKAQSSGTAAVCVSGTPCTAVPKKPAACRKAKNVLETEKARCEAGLDGESGDTDKDKDNGTWDEDTCECTPPFWGHGFCDLPDASTGARADGVREVRGGYECQFAKLDARRAAQSARVAPLEDAVLGKLVDDPDPKNKGKKIRAGGLVLDVDELKKGLADAAGKVAAHGRRLDSLDESVTWLNEQAGAEECVKVLDGTANDDEARACAADPSPMVIARHALKKSERNEAMLAGLKKIEFGVGAAVTGYTGPSLKAKIGDKSQTVRDGSGLGAGLVGKIGIDLGSLYAGLRMQASGIFEAPHSGVSGIVGAEVGPRWGGHTLVFGLAWAPNSLESGSRGSTSKAAEASIGYNGRLGDSGLAFDARIGVGYQSTGALVIVHPEGKPDEVGTSTNEGIAGSLTLGLVYSF